MKFILLFPIIFLITSCSFLQPVKTDADKTYLLNALPCPPITKTPHRRITIAVSTPDATVLYNVSNMAYCLGPHQIAYFANNSWAALPSQMLQPLIVKSLQDTHYFHAVLVNSATTHIDYVLDTQLIELQQNFYCHNSFEVLKINAQLISTATNQIIATKEFCTIVNAPCATPYGGVLAANQATACLLKQLTRFVLHTI